MSGWKLNLVVLRVADLAVSERFYGVLGLTFTREKHGRGPEHLSAESNGVVLELYPRGERSTADVRLGFHVPSLAVILSRVAECGGNVVSLTDGHAVVADPDGHRIELRARD